MITFLSLRYKCFLSSGNYWTKINLNENDLTVIVGKNGAGKSTILDAISFVLFNKPFRKINKSQLINTVIRKETMVEVDFDTNGKSYMIRRGIKPNIFEIYEDGNLISPTAKSMDHQQFLEQFILRCNHKAFCQVVVLGAASYIPFLDFPSPQRREIVENLLDLEVFSTMNSILKGIFSETSDRVVKLEYERNSIQEKINLFDRNRKILEDQQTDDLTEYQKTIDMLNNNIKNFYVDLSKIEIENEDYVYDLSERNKEIKEYTKKIDLDGANIKRLDKEILFYANHDECPTCKHDLESNFKNNIVKKLTKERNNLQIVCTKYQAQLEEFINSYNTLTERQKLRRQEIVKKEKIESGIRMTEQEILNLNKLMEKKKIRPKALNPKERESYQDELIMVSEDLEVSYKEKNTQKVLLRLLKDDGLKAVIINQYIDLINQLINNYLADMDFPCEFIIDSEFNEVIKSRYRDEFSYSSFSEGEKLRISLAILFTWREIAKRRNSISANILFFDEVLSGSLDVDGVNTFLNIIKKTRKDENIFLITHDEGTISLVDNVIEFKKIKGFSHII